MKQLIVLGNGFDLACGLKSSYADFFQQRFSELFCDGKSKNFEEIEVILKEKRDSILFSISNRKREITDIYGADRECDYFKDCSNKWSSNTGLTRWDIIFLFAQLCIGKETNLYEWQDVELIILEAVSIALGKKYISRVSYKEKVSIGYSSGNGRSVFADLIYYISRVSSINNSSEIANELLNELKKFEAIFSKYIAKQVDINNSNSKYINNALDLYERISKYSNNKTNSSNDQVDVLSFNYSLDEGFVNVVDRTINDYRLKSWSNIHGIAHSIKTPYYPSPIFGIDNHDIVSEDTQSDFRISFTKPYRVIEGGINEVRSSNGYPSLDLISIYGHSLGRADYSYFETLFDENELYHSKCKIEYYYYPGKGEETKLIKRQEAITNLYNLLTDYGMTIGKKHRSNIINRLNLENRISIIPSDKFINHKETNKTSTT